MNNQPESTPAINVANTMTETEYEDIKLHTYHLQGFVAKGDPIQLSTMKALVLSDFNVYMQYQEMALASIKDDKFIPKPDGLEQWLIEKGLVSPLDTSKEAVTPWAYKTYPFSPSYTDILKSGLIASTSVGDKDLTKINTDDLRVYALMRSTVTQYSPDPEKTGTENFQDLISKLRQILAVNEQAYLVSTTWGSLTDTPMIVVHHENADLTETAICTTIPDALGKIHDDLKKD